MCHKLFKCLLAAAATPPQEEQEFNKRSTKTTIAESSVPTKTKRQLFQDKQLDEKKKKKRVKISIKRKKPHLPPTLLFTILC